MDTKPLKLLGWRERVTLPDFDLVKIPAKIDTGAKTSVLHCSHIALIKVKNKRYVEFIPLDQNESESGHVAKLYRLPFHTERKIKNSFGQEENRYVINTSIILYGQTYPIELSLRDRSGMEYPMLLGRSFIRDKFIIDVAKSYLSSKGVKKKIIKNEQS